MVTPDEMSNAGSFPVPVPVPVPMPVPISTPLAAEDRSREREQEPAWEADDPFAFFPSDQTPTDRPVFDVRSSVPAPAPEPAPAPAPVHARARSQARAALAGWWLTSRTLAWRFDTRMADYEYQLEEAWDRHVASHFPTSEDREVARLAMRIRLWQLRTGGLGLARRFDRRMLCWEERIESDAHDLAGWTRPRLATAWARQVALLQRADARTRSSAIGLLKRAQALRPIRTSAVAVAPPQPKPRRGHARQPDARPQGRAWTRPAPETRARPARDVQIGAAAEVSAPPALRERALDAWQAVQAQQAAGQRRRHLEEVWVLRQLLHERLGVLVSPESRRIEIDDLTFAVRWSKAAAAYQLVLVTACRECGAPAISDDIRDLADLGLLVSGRPDALPLCPECRAKAQPTPTMTTAERLVEDIRELVAEELRRQQIREIGPPAPAQHEQLPARRAAYRRSS